MTFPIVGTIQKLGVAPCAYVPGLYTQAEVDDLINIDGYIPVADADEFDKIRTGAVETMGGCSIWAGSYTTGHDKNYIQIFDIADATPTCVGDGISTFLTGVYDGNELEIRDCTFLREAFQAYTGIINASNTTVRNIRSLRNTFNQTPGLTVAGVVGTSIDTNITNCTAVDCVMNGTATQSISGGVIGRAIGTAVVAISNCYATGCTINAPGGATTGTQYGRGGFIGLVDNVNCTISNCYATSITMTNKNGWYSGGFIGRNNGTVEDCYCDTDQTSKVVALSAVFAGGFCGLNNGQISRCKAAGSMDVNGQTNGGFVGQNFGVIEECFTEITQLTGNNFYGGFVGQNQAGSTITDCYAMTNVSGTERVGGFVGRINGGTLSNTYCVGTVTGSTFTGGYCGQSSGGSVTASYWDTTVGPATSAAGTGQTTVALQTPTSNTGIYSAWDAAIWDFGTSTDYPELINTP